MPHVYQLNFVLPIVPIQLTPNWCQLSSDTKYRGAATKTHEALNNTILKKLQKLKNIVFSIGKKCKCLA